MADHSTLNVEIREVTGRSKMKVLRAAGKIPAVIYGLGKDSVSLSVSADQFDKAVKTGNRIVSLSGGESGDVFIKEVQWDTWGSTVLHVDFTRVEAGKKIEVTVSIDIRGDAPGTHMGGTVEQPITEMQLLCPPRSMTDRLQININALELGQQITVADLELPEGSEAVLEPDTVVVQCIEKVASADSDEDAPEVTGAEPEVIGKKADDDDAS